MNSHAQQARASFFDDPKFLEYHQDYLEGRQRSTLGSGGIFVILLCLLPIGYHILQILDYDLLPLPQLFWNILVYLTPSRLLDAIESYTNPVRIPSSSLRGIPRTHAAKSEIMRQLLGLDTAGSLIGSVAQASRRRLSTLPGVSLITVDDGRPAGLGNWDNSCYQNSVLQGLASLDTLTEYLDNPSQEVQTMEEASRPDLRMAEALKDLIQTLNSPEYSGQKVWTPATLKNMNSFQQQDAQEYFSKVLDEIDKEIGKVARLGRHSKGLESEAGGSASVAPASIYRNPLEGLVAQRVGCTKCDFSEGLSMIPFNCLTVPLGKAWEYDITECLDEYTKLENIDGVECGKCTLLKNQRLLTTLMDRGLPPDSIVCQNTKERLAAVESALEDDDYEDKTLLQKCKIPSKNRVASTKTRQAVVARPPKSLVVHFNRSLFDEQTGELRKNTALVMFPNILDLAPWSLGSSVDNEDIATEEWKLNPNQPMIASTGRPSRLRGPLYELRAVVTHYGRHENGHYVCYRKHAPESSSDSENEKEKSPIPKQWWRLSDEDVTKVTEDVVLNQGGVFMLFYDCIEPAMVLPTKILSENPTEIKEETVATDVFPSEEQPQLEDANQLSHQVDDLDITPSPSIPLPPSSPSLLPSFQNPSTTDLSIAITIPLPSSDNDEDLSDPEYQDSISTLQDETDDTVSEDETNPTDEEEYTPTQPILVQPYNRKDTSKREKGILGPASNLVMV